MAHILSKRNRDFIWDALRFAAKPLLVSGWAAAAILAVLAFSRSGGAGTRWGRPS